MRERDNVCKDLDIALQHVSDRVLKYMRRQVTHRKTVGLIERIREEVPGIHLRTTFMVGHPGETEDDFDELTAFVEEMRFERMGAFAYSHEAGTYSFLHYADDIPGEVKQRRLDTLMNIQQSIAAEISESKVGRTFKTGIDRKEEDY